MNQKEAIAALVNLYIQEASIADEIKDVKTTAKESGLNPAICSAVAKAIVNNKVDELEQKSTDTIEAIEVSRS